MTGEKSLLADVVEKTGPTVTFGDDSKGFTKGYGNLKIYNVIIENISLVKGLKHNLLSISQFCDKGYKVVFESSICNVFDGEHIMFSGKRHGNVYLVSLDELDGQCLMAIDNDPWV